MACLQIKTGQAYSNGVFGSQWEVREVIAEQVHCQGPERPADAHCVTYRVVVGKQRRRRFTCSQSEFLRWARYEVVRNENSWERVRALVGGDAAG